MIKRIKEGKFIEVNNHTEIKEHFIFEKDGNNIILYLIDINSMREDNNSSNNYFKNADCIIMGYDVTNKKSL